METKPLSLRVLKLVLALWWWIVILGAGVACIWTIAAPSDRVEIAMWGYASDIDTSALSAADREGQKLDVSFDGPTRVKFVAANGTQRIGIGHKIIGLLIVLPYFLLAIYFVKQLRDIVRTIDEQNPFAKENARRVRVIGILIFVFIAIDCIGRLAMSGFADTMVIPQGFNLNGRIKVNEGLLVVALAMLVLSEVFRHGSRMREEQSLTV